MMRVGIDAFTLRELHLDPFGQLDWVHAHAMDGIQFGGLGCDTGRLAEIEAHAKTLGLYCQTSVTSPNPHCGERSAKDLADEIRRQVEAAATVGWTDVHTTLGGPDDRYRKAIPWARQLEDATAVMRALSPVLRDRGCRLNFETHGEATTFELVRLVEEIGPAICGVCFDTANVLVFAEDPLAAARRVAPYTHLTHCKDAILFFSDAGITRQTRPPGRGIIDWASLLGILAKHEPTLPLNIEDHKWLFSAEVFSPEWYEDQPDLSREELARTLAIAWTCTRRVHAGELPDPAAFEEVPYADEMMERILAGRDHLRSVVAAMDGRPRS